MDLDKLSSLCMSISTEWRDVQIIYKNKKGRDKNVTIPFIVTGSNGIYVFLNEVATEEVKFIYNELEKIFNIRYDGLYIFIYNDDGNDTFAYNSTNNSFLELENLYEAFDIFYYNHYIPQSELHLYKFNSFEDYFKFQEVCIEREIEQDEDNPSYVKPILSSQKVEFIESKLTDLLSSGIKEGKYTYYKDGSMTVNKIVKSPDGWKKPWESYMEARTYDYPCSDEEGNKTFLITALGGFFGLHKFRSGKILQGIFYLLSCGCCCMFYFIDMIAVMTGNYTTTNSHYFRNQAGRVEKAQTVIYNRPVKNKKLFLLAPIMALISLLALNYVYLPTYIYGSQAIAKITQNVYQSQIQNEIAPQNITGFSNEDFEEYQEFLDRIETGQIETSTSE